MSIIEAIILGIIQGFTEFLPVSSSGHLELAKVILGDTSVPEESLTFYRCFTLCNCIEYTRHF